jgi:hypothetical protein
MSTSWQRIGTSKLNALSSIRLQLHYAIQFMAAAGSALAEPLPDFSHVSLEWHSELAVFVGVPIRATIPFRVALDPASLTSVLLNKQGDAIATLPLDQQTLATGMNWLRSEISKLGADAGKIELLSYPSDFPDHAIAHGAVFDANQTKAGRQELVNYYTNTHQLLQEIVADTEDASPIRIWPHHFDIATLIMLPRTKNREPITIGVGLSPGDQSYTEPYWYVSPYPYPRVDDLPSLEGNGFWHTQNWVGAVLMASQLPKESQAQQQQVGVFLQSTLQISSSLLTSEHVSS